MATANPRTIATATSASWFDLAGGQAVADPLHIPISGWPAKAITRGYHLLTMPANRMRVAADWITDLLTRRHIVQFGLVPEQEVSLANADRRPIARPKGTTARPHG